MCEFKFMAFNHAIEARREKIGKSRDDLARDTGLSCRTIHNAGRPGVSLQADTLAKIAMALGGELILRFPEDSQ